MTVDVTPHDHTQRSELKVANVPLGTGLPTREELLVYYPAKFTWNQLKTFVNSGDLGLLKRDKSLQERYDRWLVGILQQYGSSVNYLLNHRLQWGKPDMLSLLPSALDKPSTGACKGTNGKFFVESTIEEPSAHENLLPLRAVTPEYFTVDIPAEYISIIQNDWPYSVPPEVEHTLIWTRIPIYHHNLVPQSIKARIDQDGLWGFTGSNLPPPDPAEHLPSCIPALAEWGITLEKMVISPKGTDEEEELVQRAGSEVQSFIKRRWNEAEWETAWFVNPPRLQSVPELAHIHVFAKQKAQPDGIIQ